MNAKDDSIAVRTCGLGKMYKMYASRKERIYDILGLNSLFFWRKPKYRDFWALRGIDLEIHKGERVGIIGHNGAGKSTLLKTLIGVHEPTEGSLYINGRIQALMQLGTGFHPDFTGRENIRASLGYNNMSAKEIAACEEEIIDFTELDDFIDQPVKNYSAGMYARLAFATATSIKPEILIIDEVLGAGDAYFAGKCVERMKALSVESGATVLFVSHDLASVQNMCDRCIWIDRGVMKADGPSLEVIKAYSAQVREREEMRLKIRNEKKAFSNKSIDVDYSAQLLFRMRASEGASLSFPVRKISFSYQNGTPSDVCPGMPMDTDTSQGAFLFVNENSTGWSDIKKDGTAWHRNVDLADGKCAIGGFIIQKDWKIDNIVATIFYDDMASGKFFFEYFDQSDKQYHLVKTVELKNTGKKECVVFPLIGQTVHDEKTAESKHGLPQKLNDEYGSMECVITKVRIIANGRESFVIPQEANVQIQVEYQANTIIDNPIFLVCMYLPSGQAAMQFYHELKNINGDGLLPKGIGTFIFEANPFSLGTGQYILSVAIFKNYPENGMEPPAYHLLDRKIEIHVKSEITEKIATGICIQKTRGKLMIGEDCNE